MNDEPLACIALRVVCPRLGPSEKLLLAALADYYNDAEGYAFPSIERLAIQLATSKANISRRLATLADIGLIEIHETRRNRDGRRIHVYVIDRQRIEDAALPKSIPEYVEPEDTMRWLRATRDDIRDQHPEWVVKSTTQLQQEKGDETAPKDVVSCQNGDPELSKSAPCVVENEGVSCRNRTSELLPVGTDTLVDPLVDPLEDPRGETLEAPSSEKTKKEEEHSEKDVAAAWNEREARCFAALESAISFDATPFFPAIREKLIASNADQLVADLGSPRRWLKLAATSALFTALLNAKKEYQASHPVEVAS